MARQITAIASWHLPFDTLTDTFTQTLSATP